MSYSRFNRHENMNEETLSEILTLIREVRFAEDFDRSFELENMLYGLFDGYLYTDLQVLALEILPTELASRVCKVYDICNRYPKVELEKC